MVMMGAECIQCGGTIDRNVKHVCNEVPTIGNAAAHAAQIQRNDPKEEYEGAEFNNAPPSPDPSFTYPIQQPAPPLRINREVLSIELPCECCGEYVIYKPVTHKCQEKED